MIEISPIEVRYSADPGLPYELTQGVHVREPKTGMDFHIPAGFRFDGASVPRFLWWLLPRDDHRYIKAACIHDYFYRTHHLPRVLADAMFLAVMEQHRVPRWKRRAMYYAVRLFGWRAWRADI